MLLAAGLGFALFTYGTDDRNYGPAVLLPWAAAFIFLCRYIVCAHAQIPVTMTVGSMIAFFGYLVLSCFWSSIPYTSFYFLLVFALMPLTFFTVILSPEPHKILSFVLAGVGSVIVAVMIWTLYQYAFQFGDNSAVRIRHPFLDPNNLAVFTNMALLPCVGMTFACREKYQRAICAVLAFLFLLALLATNSRMGFISTACAMAVLTPFILKQSKHPYLLAAAGSMALVLIVVAANSYMGGVIVSYAKDLLDFKTSYSVSDRLALWNSSIRIFKDHLWLGTGLATFFYYYPQYRLPTDSSDGYFVHMDPLQIGLETGIIGYILLYLMLICVMFRTMRVLLQTDVQVQDKLLVLAPFAGLLTLCLHMHMTFALYLPAMALPAGALLAWWYVMTIRVLPPSPALSIANPKGRIVLSGMALLMLCGMVWGGRAMAGIVLNKKVDELLVAGQEAPAQEMLKWEQRLAPDSYHRAHEQKAQIIREKMKQNRNASVEQRSEWFAEGVLAIDEAIKRQPRHSSLKNTKAMIYYMVGEDAQAGSVDEAIRILREQLLIDPMMMDGRMGLAMILRERGEFRAALQVMEDGMIWPRPKGIPDINYITATAKYNLAIGNRERHDQLMTFATERARMYGFVLTGQN